MSAIPASHADLLEGQIVILTTNGPDGYPQSSAVWFLNDGGLVKISLNDARQKTKNLRRDQRATLFFVDPANPFRTLEIRADARIESDTDYDFADKVGAKYGGTDLRNMDGPGQHRVVVSFEPVKVNTFG